MMRILYNTFYTKRLRGGAVVARWAHNPKVAGSNPAPATKKDINKAPFGAFYFCIL